MTPPPMTPRLSDRGEPAPPVLSRSDWALVKLLLAGCGHSSARSLVALIDESLANGYGMPKEGV